MKFFYDSHTDLLGVSFKPIPQDSTLEDRREITPGVFLIFDQKQQLSLIEIANASAHQPEVKQMFSELLNEILKHSDTIPKEILLAIEGTIKLGEDTENAAEQPEYQPKVIFDSLANVIITEFRQRKEGETLLPKQEVIPHVLASFDQDGHLLQLEMLEALQHLPFLHQFIEQGKELIQFQALFNPQ